jgi:hypothetical protein
MEQLGTRARARIIEYTTSLFVVLATFAFLDVVPLLPDAPILPLLVALGLGALSTRNTGVSVTLLYLLVFFGALWQMIGFGFFQLLRAGVGVVVLVVMVLPLLAFAYRKVELTSMSIAVLCVALMFTPAYFVSISLIAAAATVTGFASIWALSLTFVLFLVPFLLLENALYFVTSSSATTPIIFGQLSRLSQNMRPPLPTLNVFLASLPSNMMSVHAQAVSQYLTHSWDLLVIPLLLMGFVILAASLAGGLTHSMMDRFAGLHEWEGLKRLGSPLAVSLVVPAVFALLIVPLSLPSSGGFQTSLTSGSTLLQLGLMVGASVVLGVAFVARESLVGGLERVEVGRDEVLGLLEECASRLDQVALYVTEVSSVVPSSSTKSEQMALDEEASYVADVRRQVGTAGPESLIQWKDHLEGSILPSLRGAPQRLETGVMNELITLASVTVTVNGHLEEAGVSTRYPPVPDVSADAPIKDVVEAYQGAVRGIRETTVTLFDSYQASRAALAGMMDLQQVSVPVGPSALLDSDDFVTAMRLVSEEYWLDFHLRYREELTAKAGALAEALAGLGGLLQGEEARALSSIRAEVAGVRPADSVVLLERLKALRELLASVITGLEEGPGLVEKTVGAFKPKAVEALGFRTVSRIDGILALGKKLKGVPLTLDDLSKFVSGAVPILQVYAAALAVDRENLLALAHYPLARRVIERMLGNRGKLLVERLPYERGTARVYARTYASENPSVRYDDGEEALTRDA